MGTPSLTPSGGSETMPVPPEKRASNREARRVWGIAIALMIVGFVVFLTSA